MAINLPTPPKEGLEVLRGAITELMSRPESNTFAATAGVASEYISVAAPHRVYFVGADEVAAGRLLGAARLTGWRYIVLAGERPLFAAELSFAGEGKRLEFSHTNRGPFVEGTIKGVRVAEGLEDIRAGNFELRLLGVPSLSLNALWLHAVDRDFLLPMPPAPSDLAPYRLYTEEAALTMLRAVAAKRMQIRDDRA